MKRQSEEIARATADMPIRKLIAVFEKVMFPILGGVAPDMTKQPRFSFEWIWEAMFKINCEHGED